MKPKKYFNNNKVLEKMNKENIFNSVNDSFCLLFFIYSSILIIKKCKLSLMNH